jgi:hypothetical protein
MKKTAIILIIFCVGCKKNDTTPISKSLENTLWSSYAYLSYDKKEVYTMIQFTSKTKCLTYPATLKTNVIGEKLECSYEYNHPNIVVYEPSQTILGVTFPANTGFGTVSDKLISFTEIIKGDKPKEKIQKDYLKE